VAGACTELDGSGRDRLADEGGPPAVNVTAASQAKTDNEKTARAPKVLQRRFMDVAPMCTRGANYSTA
jgi:hypothetical protein